MIEIYPPGSQVFLGLWGETIPATIMAVQIVSETETHYRVAWWDGRTRHVEWVSDKEVQSYLSKEPKMKIGFHNA